jgi:hypothetical protein
VTFSIWSINFFLYRINKNNKKTLKTHKKHKYLKPFGLLSFDCADGSAILPASYEAVNSHICTAFLRGGPCPELAWSGHGPKRLLVGGRDGPGHHRSL